MLQMELRLQQEIDQLLVRAEETDASDDARFGSGCRQEDLPAELRRREQRLARIREAKARLQAEAAEARELAPDRDDDDVDPPATSDGLPLHEPRVEVDGTPDDGAQMNFTDPHSRIVESGGGFVQGYNCQAAVDEAHQVIVAQAVSNKSPDNGNLVPMVALGRDNCGAAAKNTTADAGYWTPAAAAQCAELGTDVYISTQRRKHGDTDETCAEGPPPEALDAREQMRHKLRTTEGREIYARRKAVVEPVFGQI